MRSGTIFDAWIGTVPELEAVSLPFVFSNRETAFRVIDGMNVAAAPRPVPP